MTENASFENIPRPFLASGRRWFGLKTKLLVPLFGITAIVLCIATFAVTHSAEKVLLETAKEKLISAAVTAGNNIDLQIQRARIDILSASLVPSIRAVLDPSETEKFPSRSAFIHQMNGTLKTLSDATNAYETFCITSHEGLTLANSTPTAIPIMDISSRAWFHEAMRREDIVISAPFISRITGDALIAVAKQIRHGDYTGAIVGGIQLDRTLLPALVLGSNNNVQTAVITESGVVAAALEGDLNKTCVSETPWFSSVLQADKGYIPITLDGEDNMLAFYRLPNAPLYALAIKKTSELLGPAEFVQNLGFFALILAFMLAYATIYCVLAPMIADIRSLALAANNIGSGDLSQSTPTSRNDELGDLAVSLGDMLERLKKMILRAEEATRAKSDFLARMSHEIRTPLNAIIGMAYLSLQSSLSEPQHRSFSKIHLAATNLLGIINDILDFSKVEAGRMDVEAVPFFLRKTLESTIMLLIGRADEKGINLTLNVAEDVPDILIGDALRLSQICINLCGNAIKFTPEGTVALKVMLSEVNDQTATLHFQVEDTGIGMSQDQQQSIFEAFSQADGSITRRFGGTGLGLAISKLLVELMQGTIWVTSHLGKGSVFQFTIVLPICENQELPDVMDSGADTFPQIDNARVLVVEDNEMNQEIATGLLQLMGITPDIVANGEEAVAICEKQEFDLIFMDIQMPVMDGLEATRTIRASGNYNTATVPIVAMTANAMSSDKGKSLEAGMNSHITKPISHVELAETVRYWYGKA